MNALLIASLVYASVLILLALAYTLMYRSIKAPNYSLGATAVIGVGGGKFR